LSAEAVAPQVWRITTPLPFRPRSVHAYLLRLGSGGFLVVDGGVDTPEAWQALDSGVVEAAGGWSEVAVHVVTHMHLDHLGLTRRVRQASGARLVMHRLDADRSRHAEREPADEADYRERLLREAGAPSPVLNAVEQMRAQAAGLAAFVEPDAVVDGESGDLPGAPGWRWVWTPGHTAGHLSLFRPADCLLLAGDAVLPGITPTIGVNRQSPDPVADYLAALARLDALRPELAVAGHGAPMPNPAARLRELRDSTLDETDRVLALLGTEPATAWTVAMRRHPAPDLPVATRMLAVREALAHLVHLVATGRAAADLDDRGARWFRAVAPAEPEPPRRTAAA
jgi:glyoxylase-like metal-dependent hydrolase (beta-lactamase superfamily II)